LCAFYVRTYADRLSSGVVQSVIELLWKQLDRLLQHNNASEWQSSRKLNSTTILEWDMQPLASVKALKNYYRMLGVFNVITEC